MNLHEQVWRQLKQSLKTLSTPEKAEASRRYFPNGINCLGVTAADIKSVIDTFHKQHNEIPAQEALSLCEYILENRRYSEDVLLAFGLINKFVKKNFDEALLSRFEYWLENYASNWSHVDDLCIKTIYQFLLARPHLIEKTRHWAHSKSPWCRRASNVTWVKFVKRKIGKSTYWLNKELIFNHCDLLLDDEDDFVQKSIGWLLKATSVHHQSDVIEYIENNVQRMTRPTVRYAIEKMAPETRKYVLSFSNKSE